MDRDVGGVLGQQFGDFNDLFCRNVTFGSGFFHRPLGNMLFKPLETEAIFFCKGLIVNSLVKHIIHQAE